MRDRLPTLHYSHNRRLGFETAVSRNSLMCLLVFLLCLLCLNLIDFNAVFGVLETVIYGEGIGIIDILALRVLGENAIFCTCERLKCTL